ncbi:hypothetical protein MTO96_009102 [Rhipicephalus appendiculatus]
MGGAAVDTQTRGHFPRVTRKEASRKRNYRLTFQASTKGQTSHSPGGSSLNTQQPEKILFLKDIKAFSAPMAAKNKKLVLPTPQDSFKNLGPEILPPIVLNANTLAQLGLGGLSGPVTGGLLHDAGQDGLHLKGGNAIW